jgi:tubulin-folding cofactor B
MAFQPTPADISVVITAASTARGTDTEPRFLNERRVTPTWTLTQLKSKLETMTGVPPSSQTLRLKSPGHPAQWMEGEDRLLNSWALMKGCEIEVCYVSPFPCRP